MPGREADGNGHGRWIDTHPAAVSRMRRGPRLPASYVLARLNIARRQYNRARWEDETLLGSVISPAWYPRYAGYFDRYWKWERLAQRMGLTDA